MMYTLNVTCVTHALHSALNGEMTRSLNKVCLLERDLRSTANTSFLVSVLRPAL